MQESVLNIKYCGSPLFMCIQHSCEKYTVSVHSRGRAVSLIVPFISTLFAANCRLLFLHTTIPFLSNEQHVRQSIFSLLVGQLGGIHGLVGIHIMDLLELFCDNFLTSLTKHFQALLHVVVLYQHHPHDVGIDIFFCRSWELLCII